MTLHCSDKDWLLLSRHLAGALSPRQSATLEARLATEPDLNEALNQLKRTRSLLSGLTEKKVPHNFTIKAGVVPRKQIPRFFPVFRIAAVVSSLLFAVMVGLKMFSSTMTSVPRLMTGMAPLSQEAAAADNAAPPAALKEAPSADETITPTPEARSAVGAGILTGPSPTLQVTEEEALTEAEYVPDRGLIPWASIIWSLGIITLALAAIAVYYYFQERV
jgi:anti-sigma factor RsiW